MTKTYLDLLWDIKNDVERSAKELGASCDLLWEPRDLYMIPFKCTKGKSGLEIGKDGCKLFRLNADKEELERVRRETDVLFEVAPYDLERWRKGEAPFDIEAKVPCDRELLKTLFRKLTEI